MLEARQSESDFVRPLRRRNSLSELPCGAQKTSLSKKGDSGRVGHESIRTSIFDLYKIGPGPSSSHTIGPMKICNDFLAAVQSELIPTLDNLPAKEVLGQPRFKLLCHLHGSLSATGLGHGTHTAVIGGLLGWTPKLCDPNALLNLLPSRKTEHVFPPVELGPIMIGANSIIWHDPCQTADLYHPNTLILQILEFGLPAESVEEDADRYEGYAVIFEREYYSVGGGFIEKKGCLPEDFRPAIPPFPFSRYSDVMKHIRTNNFDVAELVLQNEEKLTGATREQILAGVQEVIAVMDKSVERGLMADGILPGPIQLKRKARTVYESARKDPYNYIGFLNAYAMAASEENAAGMMVVTAPTSGSAGVLPGLLYFMKHHLMISEQKRQLGLICACLIGFLVKHNASISGAEMGCMGEIGVASAMGAAMLAFAQGSFDASAESLETFHYSIEASAEIALEHHLGMTCDPIGGFVQIPCIQRNSMGAVKAYNAHLLAKASDPRDQKISFDDVVVTMRKTGEDMNSKYKETSQGGLAVLPVAMSEC